MSAPAPFDGLRLFGPQPSVELFARQRRTGWDCWGNQVNRFEVAE